MCSLRGLHYPFVWGAEDRLLTTYSYTAPSLDDIALGRPVVKHRVTPLLESVQRRTEEFSSQQ